MFNPSKVLLLLTLLCIPYRENQGKEGKMAYLGSLDLGYEFASFTVMVVTQMVYLGLCVNLNSFHRVGFSLILVGNIDD
jgi:hypothetical protein